MTVEAELMKVELPRMICSKAGRSSMNHNPEGYPI